MWDRAQWFGLLAAATLVFGCGGEDQDGGGRDKKPDPPLSTEPPPELEASGCDLPAAPDLGALTTVAVGDGTPAGCTAEALRAALEVGGRVELDCGSTLVTIPLDEPLVVRDGTHLVAKSDVTLDGQGRTRILRTEHHSTVILEGLRFVNGHAVESSDEENGSGGAVFRGWHATLAVRECTFEDNVAEGTAGFGGGALGTASAGFTTIVASTFARNRAPLGGAIHSLLSDLFVVDSVFHANAATDGDGGAIFTDGGHVPPDTEHGTANGLVSLCGTRLTENVATKSAGAGFLYAYGNDRLVLNRCEFRGNRVTSADPGLGGAIRIDAEAFVSNTLFVANETAGQGGALWMGRGPATFENVTFAENHAAKWGGAISYADEVITLQNCTVARNLADEGSDGLFGGEGATVTAFNTLFYENGTVAKASRHCRRSLAGARNLAFPATDDDACGPELRHDDPQLARELADAGGFTLTLALPAGSPALDAGIECPDTDQRGEPRSTTRCDLGAFELP